MKIVFMGTPNFSVRILEELNKKYEVVLVVTQTDKEVGRKKVITYSPVKTKAIELGLPVFQPAKLSNDYQPIIDAHADLLVTAAYGQFVPTKVLKTFKNCINVHGSLLPKRRGGAPIQRSIIEGDKETGVTIMQMVKGMDQGVMYAKEATPILDSDNQDTLFERLSQIGCKLLLDNIEDIYNGKNLGIPQDEAEATISYNIACEEEEFNFNDTSRNIFNKVRGLSHEPGAYFKINGLRVKVYECKIVEDNSNSIPSTILETKKHLIIKTKDSAIELLVIKVEGKKEMSVQSFLNGQNLFNKLDLIK